MLHSRIFAQSAKMRDRHFQPTRSDLAKNPGSDATDQKPDLYLDGRPDIDRPLTVQFCANEPEELLAAAKLVQPFCDAVDLNLGCPQGIARKGHYGAFLQEDPDLIYRLINRLHKELDVPVTAKIRILESKEKTLEYAKTVLSAGASILTVHGRQRDQKGQNTGLADWSVIRYLREHLPQETVLFANGNILRHEDIDTCMQQTGADGVMSAEGNLHDPTIFAGPPMDLEDRSYWRGRDGRGGYRVDAIFRRYMSIIYKYVLESVEPKRAPLFHPADFASRIAPIAHASEAAERPPPAKRRKRNKDEPVVSINLCAMQSHLFSLLRPLIVLHTDVRDALARTRVGDMESFEEVLRMTEAVVQDGILDYERNPEKYEEASEEQSEPSEITLPDESSGHDDKGYGTSLQAVKACKRPWWVAQPYVRPLPQEAIQKGGLTIGRKHKRKMEEMAEVARKQQKADDIMSQADQESREMQQGNGVEKPPVLTDGLVCG